MLNSSTLCSHCILMPQQSNTQTNYQLAHVEQPHLPGLHGKHTSRMIPYDIAVQLGSDHDWKFDLDKQKLKKKIKRRFFKL